MKIIVFIGFIDAITVPAVSDTIYYSIFFFLSNPEIQIQISIKIRTWIYPERCGVQILGPKSDPF